MASVSHFSPGNIFTEPPTRLKVGKRGTIYYAHPGVFSSSALAAHILGSWKGTADDTIDLTEYDEQTIESALSYFYTKDYYLAQITPESDLTAEPNTKPDDSHFTGEDFPVEENTDENATENSTLNLASNDVEVRPLTPIEDFFDLSSIPTLHSLTAEHGGTRQNGQTLAADALGHAKIYSFAHKYLMSDLEEFATRRLARTLADLQLLKISISPPLAEAIRLVYSTTPSDPEIPARRLLSHFVALGSSSLTNEYLDMLLLQGGDFAVDVFHKLGRKIDDLMSKSSTLELMCSEVTKDLTSSRENVAAWEAWNSRLPSKWRWRGHISVDDELSI